MSFVEIPAHLTVWLSSSTIINVDRSYLCLKKTGFQPPLVKLRFQVSQISMQNTFGNLILYQNGLNFPQIASVGPLQDILFHAVYGVLCTSKVAISSRWGTDSQRISSLSPKLIQHPCDDSS